MPSVSLLEIKNVIRSVTMEQARLIAVEALSLSTGVQVEAYLVKKLKEILPEIYGG